MKRLMLPFVVFTLAACDGGGGSSPQAEDTAPVDVLDVIPMDTAPDIAPDVAPDIAPDTPPDIPEGCTPEEHDGGDGTCVPLGTCVDGFHDDGEGICVPEGDCAPGFVLGGDGVCVPEGTCSDGYHDGGEGICVPEGECAHGFSDGGDGSCVPEGSCAAGYHDGGDGACLPDGACIPGFFIDPESEDGACRAEIVISDPEVGGTQPMILWDGTGATAIWYAPGEPGKWMKIRMTFKAELLGEPGLLAMDVVAPGFLSAIPTPGGGFQVVWEQSEGILRCMRVQQDGSSTTNTLATDVITGLDGANVSLASEETGARVAWVDDAGAPHLALVDESCQIVGEPLALPLDEGETLLAVPVTAAKDGVTLVGWSGYDAEEGFHRVLSYDGAWSLTETQTWQDGPGVVEEGLRLFPRTLGFGFLGLTLGPFGGGVPTPILRDLDKDGIPKAAPGAPFPTPPEGVAEPWAVQLTDAGFTAAWADPDSGSLWVAAFDAAGEVLHAPVAVATHGADAEVAMGPGALTPIPGVGHALVWSSALAGSSEIYVAIIDEDGVRLH